MKSSVQSIRLAPKKANLIAKMVRGMPVPDAMELLRRTHKKGARIVELLLRSAIANAGHNDKQDAQTMIIKTIVVNQGQAYRRGVPMARGRTRPMKKFLSHIDLVLGFATDDMKPVNKKMQKSQKNEAKVTSQKSETPVQKPRSAKKQATASASKKKSSDSSESSRSGPEGPSGPRTAVSSAS